MAIVDTLGTSRAPYTLTSPSIQPQGCTVFPRFSSFPFQKPPFQPCHGPTSPYNDYKGSEADGPHKGNQNSPIPGRLAYQGLIPGGGTSIDFSIGRPNAELDTAHAQPPAGPSYIPDPLLQHW